MDSAASWSAELEGSWRTAINFSDYIVPPGGFTNFNHFFTRQIRRELRPIASMDNAAVAVAPSDGYAWLQDSNVQRGSSFHLKADNLDVEQLLGYNPLYEHFVGSNHSDAKNATNGGTALINFLDTPNYHRFWAPVSGRIIAVEQLGGLYVANGAPCCVADHRRAYIIFETEEFGKVAMATIGMYDISSIRLSAAAVVGQNVSKGTELGHFACGGSEIITLFQPGALLVDSDLQTYEFGAKRLVGQHQGVLHDYLHDYYLPLHSLWTRITTLRGLFGINK